MTNGPPPPRAPHGRKVNSFPGAAAALRITAIYAIIAALWIFTSDKLLSIFIVNPTLITRLQTWKGFFFIAVTSLFLYMIIRHSYSAINDGQFGPAADEGETARTLRPSVSVPITAFIILTFAIIAAGYLIFDSNERNSRNAIEAQVTTVASLKTRQVEEWLDERRGEARTMTDNPLFVRRVMRWLARGNPGDEDRQSIHERFSTLITIYGYRQICLLDRHGEVVLTAGSAQDYGPNFRPLALEAMASGKMLLSDIHWEETAAGRRLELGLFAPLSIVDGEGKKSIGAIYLGIDPMQKLYPLIQTWPTPSQSAEALIFRREGDEVVFLNELRHRKGAPLTIRLPVAQRLLPAAMAIRGKRGILEGVDYRGVPVLAYITPVRGSSWFLVAKIDSSEVFAPIYRLQNLVTVLVGVFIIAAGGIVYFWWRQQHARLMAVYYRSELERRSLATRFDNLIRNANDSILLFDEKGRIIDANERAAQSYGYPRETLIGMSVAELRTPETLADLDDQWRRASTAEGVRFETLHRRSDGRVFPVEVSSRSVVIGDRGFQQSIIRDISERKRAEEELRESERNYRTLSEQFDALLNALPDRIFLLDSNNRIIWANRALAQELGADPTGSEGTWCFHALQKRSEPCAECPALRSFASSRLESGSITTPGGRVLDLRAVPVFSGDGKVRGVIEIARDVTEHQRLEAQLRHSQKMEAIGTLAGGIAHDFNNILTAIIGYGNLIQLKMADGEPLREKVDKILAAAGRAAALTQGLLAYSRKEAIDLRPVDLNNIINRFYHMLSRIIGEDIELKVMTADDKLLVLADAGQIEQVLTNLATNARDAMPRGGTLLITAKETRIDANFIATHAYGTEGRFAVVTVSDTGSGMDKLTLEHIFEPFFTTKEVGKGTGLGLAIAYGIVKQHEGYINAYSEPGEGTTFRLYLPLTDLAPEREVQEASLPVGGKGEAILLVEDNEEIRSFFHELLTSHGYRVFVAADGEEGVEKFRGHGDDIDLLLLDVIMPRKNGKETLDEVRTIKPHVKALFMSGYTADIISRKGISTEGLEFIAKPFSAHALLMKIREVLDRQTPD